MSSKELDNPITLQLRNDKTHLTCCLQSLHSMDLEYDLASQKRKSIATEQWPSRCSSIRTDPSHQALHQSSNFTPFPNEIETQFSTKQEQTIITKHLEISLTSRNNSNSWRSQSLSNDRLISTIPSSWSRRIRHPSPRTKQKRCSRNTIKHHPSSITDECQRTKNKTL